MTLKNTFLVSSVYKRKLSIAWFLAVVAIVGLGYFYQGNVALFQGIAEASETIISVPSATEIVKVHVMPGQEIKADLFAPGDKVDATAISKGKGFQGAIHRHGLSYFREPYQSGTRARTPRLCCP